MESVLFLCWASLLITLQTCEGAGTYTVSSRVFPSEVIRQGIGQDNPCPGDRVVFTCTRSESSPTAVRWTANGTPLYTFGIPSDLGTPRANQDAGFPGLVGTLVDATMFTLLVDLTLATDIINGTAVACGEVISGVTSPIFTLFIIGVASAPATVIVGPAGFTGIYVNVTIPNDGSVCVDEYQASISGIPTSMSSLTQLVTDVTQTVYSFRFPVDLCSDMLMGVSATALAITDDLSGPSLTVEGPRDTLNRSDLITSIFTSQMFTSSGIMFTLINDLVDPNLKNLFNITCDLIESPILLNCIENTVGIPSITEKTILIPYNAGLVDSAITFQLAYSYRLCSDNEVVNLSVRPVNSSVSEIVQGVRAVTVEFDESVFDVNSVRVNYSSNCTPSVIVSYNNPLLLTIPDIGANTGRCQYNIQLVDINSQQIGYPIIGFFEAEELPVVVSQSGASTVGAVIGVLLVAGLLIAAVVVTVVVSYTLYIKKRTIVYNTGSKIDHEKRLAASDTTEQLVDQRGSSDKHSEMSSSNSSSNPQHYHMKSSLGIFSDDLEDLTEGIFKTAYTELGDTNAGTRISFSSVPQVSPSLGLKAGHDRRDVAAARKPRPPTRKTTLQLTDDDTDQTEIDLY